MLRARSVRALAIALGLLVWSTALASAQVPRMPAILPEMGFFPEPPVRGPLIVFPTFTLSEEYNDNIFLNNAQRRSDFITGFTPGIRVVMERETYRWAAGYNFTAEKYADNSQLDAVFQRQLFFLNGLQRLSPRLTLTLSEVFIENNNTNLLTPEGFAVGRQVSRSNSLNPGLIWDFGPQTSLRANLSYVLQRYGGQGAASSDIVRLTTDVNHNFSPQLTGILGYEGAYIRVEGQPDTTTHTPRVGVTYRFTATRTGTIIVGPTFRVTSGDSGVDPYASASLTEEFYWGLAGLTFSHLVGTAGGLGGTTENTSVGGFVSVTNLLRDLRVELAPRYSIAKSTGPSGATNNVDAKAFTIDLRASYQFTPWLAAVAGYRFFHQRSDTTTTTLLTNDVDQNRVFFGVQFGAPIKFD